MTYITSKYGLLIIAIFLFSCKNDKHKNMNQEKNNTQAQISSFKTDYDFLREYTDIILLEDLQSNGKVAISPALQGRVMTTTANGWHGKSYGWINKKHFISGDTLEHINIYGGEERLWFGPEGGQYSIFFKKGTQFKLENWFTPKLIDTEPFNLVEQTDRHAVFFKTASLTNYSDFTFNFNIERTISILSINEINKVLGIEISEKISTVGYQTRNTLKNIGEKPWLKETGLLSIWLLGMLKHSPTTTVIIPYVSGEESKFGPVVNDDYFGKVPSDRIKVDEKAIYFKADGQQRGKIGLSPQRATDVMGSYDSEAGTLTIVKYNKPENKTDYVNSKWEIQENPYHGDVINSYNDGPPEPGKEPLGPFYELETSSPAAALGIGDSITHEQYTFHFEGNEFDLNTISMKILGVSIEKIRNIFNK
jgi:hypothetical protein